MGRLFPVLFVIAVLVVLGSLSLFTVSETELAISTEFGAVTGSHYAPGLHVKWPWDVVTKFDRRILSQTYNGETFLTNDNRGLIADFYVKWRVKDVVLFYTSNGGREDAAGERLADMVKDGIKSVVAQRTLQQIVSAERAAVTSEMFGQASKSAADLGVELIDVRVQRIDLPEDVAQRIFESMKQQFAKIAGRLRAAPRSSPMASAMRTASAAPATRRRRRSMRAPIRRTRSSTLSTAASRPTTVLLARTATCWC
jgi:modulator of FtsH protease HflC